MKQNYHFYFNMDISCFLREFKDASKRFENLKATLKSESRHCFCMFRAFNSSCKSFGLAWQLTQQLVSLESVEIMEIVCLETGKLPGVETKKGGVWLLFLWLCCLPGIQPWKHLPLSQRGCWELGSAQCSTAYTGSEFLAGPFGAKYFYHESSKSQEMMWRLSTGGNSKNILGFTPKSSLWKVIKQASSE